jgi:hypothetical protein
VGWLWLGPCPYTRPSPRRLGRDPTRGFPEEGPRAGQKQKVERAKQLRRGAKAWENSLGLEHLPGCAEGQPNRLLTHAVLDASFLNAYAPAVEGFLQWAAKRGLQLNDVEQIDKAVADRMAERLYLEREGISAGANLLAGVLAVWPQWQGQLPRAARALKAWRQLDPGGAGEAIAAEMVVCMADWLQQQGGDDEQQAAEIMLVSFDTYARQQDIFQLRAADVTVVRSKVHKLTVALQFGVSARGERAKTGTDQGVIVDYDFVQQLLIKRKALRADDQRLFSISRATFHEWYYKAAQELQVELPPPHSLRHAGPSRDAYTKYRPLAEIQKRGRWEAASSVTRYAKPSWYAAVIAKTPCAIIEQGAELMKHWKR